MLEGETVYSNGVVCLHAEAEQIDNLGNILARYQAQESYGFALVLFSNSEWDESAVVNLMSSHMPDMHYAACSTAGEITPNGMTDGNILVMLFPKTNFEISAFPIAGRDQVDMETLVSQIIQQKTEFFTHNENEHYWPLAICLMDGLSNSEESLAAALHWGFEEIPLLGGSAGDNLKFENTTLILDGERLANASIILMMKSKIEFQVFKTENFVPTDQKLVVTQSEPDKRVVWEFNGTPAAETYSHTVHSSSVDLAPQSFASHPLVVKVGGEYFCRSIQKVNEDGSLTFFCAIDDGIVLTVAEPTGMVETTKKKLCEIDDEMGGIDFILGFDCILRKIDASNRQVTRKISEVYQDYNVVGFNTYGEQYRSMHLNQTLTGVAFALPNEQKGVGHVA